MKPVLYVLSLVLMSLVNFPVYSAHDDSSTSGRETEKLKKFRDFDEYLANLPGGKLVVSDTVGDKKWDLDSDAIKSVRWAFWRLRKLVEKNEQYCWKQDHHKPTQWASTYWGEKLLGKLVDPKTRSETDKSAMKLDAKVIRVYVRDGIVYLDEHLKQLEQALNDADAATQERIKKQKEFILKNKKDIVEATAKLVGGKEAMTAETDKFQEGIGKSIEALRGKDKDKYKACVHTKNEYDIAELPTYDTKKVVKQVDGDGKKDPKSASGKGDDKRSSAKGGGQNSQGGGTKEYGKGKGDGYGKGGGQYSKGGGDYGKGKAGGQYSKGNGGSGKGRGYDGGKYSPAYGKGNNDYYSPEYPFDPRYQAQQYPFDQQYPQQFPPGYAKPATPAAAAAPAAAAPAPVAAAAPQLPIQPPNLDAGAGRRPGGPPLGQPPYGMGGLPPYGGQGSGLNPFLGRKRDSGLLNFLMAMKFLNKDKKPLSRRRDPRDRRGLRTGERNNNFGFGLAGTLAGLVAQRMGNPYGFLVPQLPGQAGPNPYGLPGLSANNPLVGVPPQSQPGFGQTPLVRGNPIGQGFPTLNNGRNPIPNSGAGGAANRGRLFF